MIIQLSLNQSESTSLNTEDGLTIVSLVKVKDLGDKCYVDLRFIGFFNEKPCKFNVSGAGVNIDVDSYIEWSNVVSRDELKIEFTHLMEIEKV